MNSIILGTIVVTMLVFTWALLSIVRVVKMVDLSVLDLVDGAKKAAGVQDAHGSAIDSTVRRIHLLEKYLGIMMVKGEYHSVGVPSGGVADRATIERLLDIKKKATDAANRQTMVLSSDFVAKEVEKQFAKLRDGSWRTPDRINLKSPKPKKGRKS